MNPDQNHKTELIKNMNCFRWYT